jgi:hypothetical protein
MISAPCRYPENARFQTIIIAYALAGRVVDKALLPIGNVMHSAVK